MECAKAFGHKVELRKFSGKNNYYYWEISVWWHIYIQHTQRQYSFLTSGSMVHTTWNPVMETKVGCLLLLCKHTKMHCIAHKLVKAINSDKGAWSISQLHLLQIDASSLVAITPSSWEYIIIFAVKCLQFTIYFDGL